jgi:hypothetical protein
VLLVPNLLISLLITRVRIADVEQLNQNIGGIVRLSEVVIRVKASYMGTPASRNGAWALVNRTARKASR